jgi:transposase
MAPLILTPRQRSDLEYLAAHNPVGRERCRAQALLWLDEGETPDQVADALRVSRRTVYYWVERYHERDGRDLVRRRADAPRPGRPRAGGGGIDSWAAEVIDTDPRKLGYHQTVWTAPLLVRYLRDHHGVGVSRKTVSRAIARLGIRWKRPRHQLARRPDTWRQSKGGSNAG